jgi:hypothetical protein
VGLLTLVPRPWAVRQAWAAWGQQPRPWPWRLAKPGRTRQAAPRRWQGRRVVRQGEVADADGRRAVDARRFLVVPSRQVAPPAAGASTAAQATAAERRTAHIQRVAARWLAGAADAEAAMAADAGRGQGRRGRQPRPWRSPGLPDRVAAVSVPQTRARRGRPPQAEALQVAIRSRLGVRPEAGVPSEAAPGWTVLTPPGGPAQGTDVERLQAYQAHHRTVAAGWRWRQPPAAIRPVWLEQPARRAALAMLTVVGWRGSAVLQRQVRLYLRAPDRHVPGQTGLTNTPTAAVGFALCTPVLRVHFAVDTIPHLQAQGVQDAQRLVCEAVGMDQAWYQGAATGQNAPPWATPP